MIKKLLISTLLLTSSYIGKAQVEPFLLNTTEEGLIERTAWVDSVYNQMNLEQRVGQLFVFTIAPQLNKPTQNLLKKVVKDYQIGGLLFSGGEVANQVKLTNMAQQWASLPLMITFDGEWGLSMRLKNTPKFPRNMVLGSITDETLLYAYGKEMGRECGLMGIHVNFAPVGDVNINPENPVINTRSFGESPKAVAENVIAYSKGLESQLVLSVTKHFPGHGDTNVDSHKALPILPFTRERLDSIELYPFRALTASKLGGVMVGHLDVPSLGTKKGEPSSLSKNVVQGLLKDSIGFRGLVFTDALAMRGAGSNEGVCLRAIQAGNDMLLSPPQIKRELDIVVQAVKDGVISDAELEAKCKKVLTYKYALGLNKSQKIRLSGLMDQINTAEASTLIKNLEIAAITLIKNEGRALPLLTNQVQKIAFVYAGKNQYSSLKNGFNDSVKVDFFAVDPSLSVSSRESLTKKLEDYDRVFVCLATDKLERYDTYFEVLQTKRPLSFLFFTGGQNLRMIEKSIVNAESAILAHSVKPHVLKAVGEIIRGERLPSGRLAVSIGESFPAGVGLKGFSEKKNDTEEDVTFLAEDLGFNTTILDRIDSIAKNSIAEGAFTGSQIVILKDGHLAYQKAFGSFSGEHSSAITNTSIFDLASLTKTTATLLAVMKLYDTGKLNLTDKVAQFIPELKNDEKGKITIRELLYHESGMPAGLYIYDSLVDEESYKGALFKTRKDALHTVSVGKNTWGNAKYKFLPNLASSKENSTHKLKLADNLWMNDSISGAILKKIYERPLLRKRYRYSCLGFILLQKIVESITEQPLNVYLAEQFYIPMGVHLLFNPLQQYNIEDIVPSNEDKFFRKSVVRGHVHDETAALLGGVSGNAGLFGNAMDVAKVYQMLLNGGVYENTRYLGKSTVDLFTTRKSKLSRRGLGFDKPSDKEGQPSPCSLSTPKEVYGHTGFTGTAAWVDPVNNLVYVFLSNRIYPSVWPNKLSELEVREKIQDVIYESLKPIEDIDESTLEK